MRMMMSLYPPLFHVFFFFRVFFSFFIVYSFRIFFSFCVFLTKLMSSYHFVIVWLSSSYCLVFIQLLSNYHPVIIRLLFGYLPVIIRLCTSPSKIKFFWDPSLNQNLAGFPAKIWIYNFFFLMVFAVKMLLKYCLWVTEPPWIHM